MPECITTDRFRYFNYTEDLLKYLNDTDYKQLFNTQNTMTLRQKAIKAYNEDPQTVYAKQVSKFIDKMKSVLEMTITKAFITDTMGWPTVKIDDMTFSFNSFGDIVLSEVGNKRHGVVITSLSELGKILINN